MLAYAFPPLNLSGSKRPFRFAKYLPTCGYGVEVISASGRLPAWDNVHPAPAETGAPPAAVERASRTIQFVQRRFLPYNDQLPWIPHAVHAAREIITRRPVSLVFSTSPPICSHLAASEIKRRFGVKWVADFRDPLYGNPFRNRKLAWMYDACVERHIVKRADAIIANTDKAAESLRERYPRWADKIHLIWNGYDPEERVEPQRIPRRNFRILAHVGSIYGARHPGLLLSSLERLIRAGKLQPTQIKILLVGGLEPSGWREKCPFWSLVERGCLEYSGETRSEEEARDVMGEADLLLLLDLNDRNTDLQVPAKLFDYIRIGRPVLAYTADGSPTERILQDSGVPHVLIRNNDGTERSDQKVLDFLQLPAGTVQASDSFRQNFAAPSQTGTLAAIFDKVLQSPAKR